MVSDKLFDLLPVFQGCPRSDRSGTDRTARASKAKRFLYAFPLQNLGRKPGNEIVTGSGRVDRFDRKSRKA